MSTHQGATATAFQVSIEERERILEQLNRLLETHHFKNSRRYPALLRFIVEETLEGRGDLLKERLLGVRVFDRPADYDTAADPIVRVTIAEIRKRIAQYYHDEEHDAELRIELMPGCYAPEFRFRNSKNELLATSGSPLEGFTPASSSAVKTITPRATSLSIAGGLSRTARYVVGISLGVLVAMLVTLTMRSMRNTPLNQLWAPFLTSQHPILFCVPTDVGAKRNAPEWLANVGNTSAGQKDDPADGSTFLAHEALGENVVYSDMLATLKIANVLALRHRDYRVKLNRYTNLEDLRQGPAVLIGGLDNQWTMRALAPLRFHFAGSDEDRYWIADTKNPGNRDWSLDLKLQYAAVTRDYAIVARLHNEQTGQPQFIVAGIGMSGTAAAGEFIADERRVAELQHRIGPAFKDHDFEIVLSTDVVNGIAGAPKIIASAVF